MPLHTELHTLVGRYGAEVLADADGLRATLDDFLDEDAASPGEINLLVDAVRLGAYERLISMLDNGAEPRPAVRAAGEALAHDRGGADLRSAQWACAVLGFAAGRIPPEVVLENHGANTPPGQPPDGSEPTVPDSTPARVSEETVVRQRSGGDQPTWRSGWQSGRQESNGAPRRGPRPRSRARYWVPLVALAVAAALVAVLALTDRGPPGAVTSGGATSGTQSGTPGDPTSGSSPGQTDVAFVPAPFQSAKLYGFARHLFGTNDCFVPKPGEFPVSDSVPDSEVVKCIARRGPFSGTFFCHDNSREFLEDRNNYLGYALPGTKQPVTGPPAGRATSVDGRQVAYQHKGGGDARVYWDSPKQLCAAELQANNRDVAAAVHYWRQGRQ